MPSAKYLSAVIVTKQDLIMTNLFEQQAKQDITNHRPESSELTMREEFEKQWLEFFKARGEFYVPLNSSTVSEFMLATTKLSEQRIAELEIKNQAWLEDMNKHDKLRMRLHDRITELEADLEVARNGRIGAMFVLDEKNRKLREQEPVIEYVDMGDETLCPIHTDGFRPKHGTRLYEQPKPPEPQWISVKDRLPKLHQEILVWHKTEDDDYIISTAHFNQTPKIEFTGVGKYKCKLVTHWMPLPTSPKEE
jgi:hypothetical protein